MDRQTILQSMIEGALRAAADPSVTGVFRSWDFYDSGTDVQKNLPILVVAVTDDEELGPDFGLFRASCSISVVAHWAEQVRDSFDRIRGSVRSAMHALPLLSAYGVTIDGVREISCTEPDVVTPQGDVTMSQTLSFQLWFSAPVTPDAILDQTVYLADRDPETGIVYTTCQAQDPRRIDRWIPGAVACCSQGFGAWSDRKTLTYSSPVQPLSTIPASARVAADT